MATSQHANRQPTGNKKYVENVAIVGVGGRCGRVIADALGKGGRHRVTAITRTDSANAMPVGLHVIKKVDYANHASLVKALEGQDVLIITMNAMAPPESQFKLIDAAVAAGVKYIMPNEWGFDLSNESVCKDTFAYDRLTSVRQHIERVGGDQTRWIGLCCSFWYEISLAGTEARYGFDFDQKKATLYNDGNTKIHTSTWPQIGRAVASLLSLKVLPDDENDKSASLSQYFNKSVYISSFFVSQRDMFESVLRVTGGKESDWLMTKEDVVERYRRGVKMIQAGQMVGHAILLYARVFYADGSGDIDSKLDNEVLGLPKESLDEATKVAIEMASRGETNAFW